jgi:hypothetical protein
VKVPLFGRLYWQPGLGLTDATSKAGRSAPPGSLFCAQSRGPTLRPKTNGPITAATAKLANSSFPPKFSLVLPTSVMTRTVLRPTGVSPEPNGSFAHENAHKRE